MVDMQGVHEQVAWWEGWGCYVHEVWDQRNMLGLMNRWHERPIDRMSVPDCMYQRSR